MAETPRYPLIQASPAAIVRQRADRAFLYERIMPAKPSLLFQQMKIEERQVIIMCRAGEEFQRKISRGDILYADLGVQYQGSTQGGKRPVVVVSNNRANSHSTVITVVPLSTKICKKRSLPTHIFVSTHKAEGLEQHSIALCEQVTALNFDCIIERIGKVGEDTLKRITEGVQVQVGVFDRYN